MRNNILTTCLALFCCFCLKAQVALSYFPFQSVIGISSPTHKPIFVDVKVETNTFFTNTNIELSPKFVIKRNTRSFFYSGPGLSINPAAAFADLPVTNGYFLDLGFRLKPIKNQEQFQVVFEFSPFISAELNSGSPRSKLGLGWEF
ncbi:MAG: hypothetical protein LCH37_13655 [Bacteroidetes bacterium]|nr:hypothetical protein [Bacteroidota bacterium]